MLKRKTTERFIAEAKTSHGDKYDYSLVEYASNKKKVCIICPIHGEFWQRPCDHLKGHGCRSCAQNRNEKRKCGKGRSSLRGVVNDLGSSAITTQVFCVWRRVLTRGLYNKGYISKYPTYKDCSVCDEWLTFSKFKKWFEDPVNGYKEGYHLDKDILIKGNKVYGPDTCCFVPKEINYIFKKGKQHKNSSCPIGVHIYKDRFVSQLSRYNERVFIGCFNDAITAFIAYKSAKEAYIKEVAEDYYSRGAITKKVYDAMMKYEVEITD